MNVDSADRVVHQNLLDFRISAAPDQHYGQPREVEAQAPGSRAQNEQAASLRQAAHMEIGRGQNIYTIV